MPASDDVAVGIDDATADVVDAEPAVLLSMTVDNPTMYEVELDTCAGAEDEAEVLPRVGTTIEDGNNPVASDDALGVDDSTADVLELAVGRTIGIEKSPVALEETGVVVATIGELEVELADTSDDREVGSTTGSETSPVAELEGCCELVDTSAELAVGRTIGKETPAAEALDELDELLVGVVKEELDVGRTSGSEKAAVELVTLLLVESVGDTITEGTALVDATELVELSVGSVSVVGRVRPRISAWEDVLLEVCGEVARDELAVLFVTSRLTSRGNALI